MILLDTHVWIWMHVEPSRISTASLRILEEAPALAISVLTIWETKYAIDRGRLSVSGPPDEVMEAWRAAVPVECLPITEEIVMAGLKLPFVHGDPFDRLIGATAAVHELTLRTADPHLWTVPGIASLPA